MPPLRIAIVGTRGIPANYGGFETFAQELSVRLVRRGHEVTVYCRRHYCQSGRKEFQGVRLAVLPAIRHKYLDTVSHTGLSILHSMFCPFDIVLVCNAANAPFCFLPRGLGRKVVLNVDGLERNRKKWNFLARLHYRASERLACLLPTEVVTDARVIQTYFQERYGQASTMIPYGSDITLRPPGPVLARLGLSGRDYYLYVSRLEPENNAHLVIRLFEGLRTDRKLLVVGDAPYGQPYIARLKETADRRILFPGAIYGEGYEELVSNTYCYIHATEVGGTHPALVENMFAGNLVWCLNTPENAEVLGETGLLFPGDAPERALELLQTVEDEPERWSGLPAAARERARAAYSWDAVVQAYLDLFHK